MRKMDNGYFYDIFTNTLIITKEFERKASHINSTEYRTLLTYRQEHSNLTVSYWKESHTRKSGISYRDMEKYIELYPDKAERLNQFEAMKKYAKATGKAYPFMKEWFSKTYPDFGKQNPQLDGNGFLTAEEPALEEA